MPLYRTLNRPTIRLLGLVLWLSLATGLHAATSQVILQNADVMALDQPRVTFQVNTSNTDTFVGPPVYNEGLLDSGSQGILLGTEAYITSGASVDPNLYQQQTVTPAGGSPYDVQYKEVGIGGYVTENVYVPYTFYFAGASGVAHPLLNTTLYGRSDIDLGYPAAVGTPVMTGRVTNLDLTPMANIDFITTQFSDTPPPVTADTYHINLGQVPPDPASGQFNAGDPTPTLAPAPTVGMTLHQGSTQTTGSFVVDTGGQFSLISSSMVAALGIDTTGAPTVPLTGADGNQVDAPEVIVDKIVIPTAEGVNLVLTNVPMVEVNVAGLDGTLGMNILTSAYLGATNEGWFRNVIFNFTNPNDWQMRLDLNPAYDNVQPIPEPATAALLLIGAVALLGRQRRACRA